MIKTILTTLTIVALIVISGKTDLFSQPCSDAGIATSNADSVCYEDTTTLTLSGYIGAIQWQSSIDNITFADETGSGSTTDSYDVNPQETTYYRAVVTASGCPSDTGNVITLTVGTIPVPSASAVTVCGPGPVTLTGSGSGTLHWYTDPTGGYPIDTGATITTFIPVTTTLWLEDNTQGGSGSTSPIQITELNPDPDILEIQNVSNQPVDVTGWQVAISDNYTNINISNPIVQVLSGVMQPGDILTWVDSPSSAPNYWGNNMLWNSGAGPQYTAWALILDAQNNVRDFVPFNFLDAQIQSMSTVINGNTVMPGTIWSGDGALQNVNAGPSNQRTGVQDNDIASDFIVAPPSTGVTNPSMTLPFLGFGCSSPRIPVLVTVTSSDAVTITPTLPSLCLGDSTQLTASSNNSNYSYTWTPSTGLNTTSGAVVVASPAVTTTYVVLGDDGVCTNLDTITIDVGTPSDAGTALTFQDTICIGNNTNLILQNSNGTVQWQSWNGSSWINETGTGFDSTTYTVSPSMDMTYRAVVTSAGCPPDTSGTLDITVLSITEPVVTDTSLCGGGNVSLTATGVGNFNWYDDSTSTSPFFTGATYSYNAVSSDTFWVEAFGGANHSIGPVNPGIGNQLSGTSNDHGCAFDVIAGCVIESVKVFPQQAGSLTINLRQTQGGPILASYTTSVVAALGQDIPIGFAVSPGTNYRLELASGSVPCTRNSTGSNYPYQVANGPLEITGYVNPNFGTGGSYYWFYDWKVTEGCKSGRVPVVVTVNSFPPTPTIGLIGFTLISSAASGNQWLLNGTIIPGATQQSYFPTQTGTYTVAVTENGCTSISPPFVVTTIGLNEIDGVNFELFPNPADTYLKIRSGDKVTFDANIRLLDMQGRFIRELQSIRKGESVDLDVDVTGVQSGIYFIEINSSKGSTEFKVQISH